VIPKFIHHPHEERGGQNNLVAAFKNRLRIVPMIVQ